LIRSRGPWAAFHFAAGGYLTAGRPGLGKTVSGHEFLMTEVLEELFALGFHSGGEKVFRELDAESQWSERYRPSRPVVQAG
jgi:hypothetical protein